MKLIQIMISVLFLISCSASTPSKKTIKEAYEKVLSDKAIFLDVRESDEVNQGVIKNARWIPLSSLQENQTVTLSKVKKLAQDKEIYIYCRSGKRSGIFVKTLKENGIISQNIGGFSDLQSLGLPTQDRP
jgi:rhodanese-related sulfurtransferase